MTHGYTLTGRTYICYNVSDNPATASYLKVREGLQDEDCMDLLYICIEFLFAEEALRAGGHKGSCPC